jgi:hypothetical protein
MFGNHFYHERIRKAVATFGSLFNNLWVVRKDSYGKTLNQQRVPLSYSPAEKYLQRIKEQASLTNDMVVAIKLPRMSFELTSLAYDPTRMLPKMGNINVAGSTSSSRKKIYNTVPYNLAFQLNIFARAQDDCLQIVEQILPYFSPQYTITFRPIEGLKTLTEDVPIILNSVSFADDYEGALEDRRVIVYTLDFEMKCNFHSDISDGSIIRKSINNIYQAAGGILGEDLQSSRVSILTDPVNVGADSDYGFTSVVERYEELFATTYALTLSAEPATALASINSSYGVSNILLIDSGAGFSFTPDVIISTPPGAEQAYAITYVDSATRKISRIELTDSGTNYLTTPTVAVFGPDLATLALATATLSDSSVGGFIIASQGSNYDARDSAPTVSIGLPDSGDNRATATAILTGQYVTGINLINPGSGYYNIPSVIIQTPPSSTTALARAIINDQRISYIEIVDSGTNYSSVPTVSIAAPAGETAASAVATINVLGELSSITITDPGSNYRTPPTVRLTNPIPNELEQYIDSEQVQLTLSNGVIVNAYVRSWNDSDNILTIDTLSATDNQSHEIPLGTRVTGLTSNSSLVVANIVQGDKGF